MILFFFNQVLKDNKMMGMNCKYWIKVLALIAECMQLHVSTKKQSNNNYDTYFI